MTKEKQHAAHAPPNSMVSEKGIVPVETASRCARGHTPRKNSSASPPFPWYAAAMADSSDTRRRWLGGIALALALAMLIAGQTVLSRRLGPLGFAIFWLVCLLFTCVAIVVAFRDLSVVRRRTREEQRALFESTLGEIARQRAAKAEKKSDTAPDAN